MNYAPDNEFQNCADFVAVHESVRGPKRHFAAPNNRVAIGVTTDIDRHVY